MYEKGKIYRLGMPSDGLLVESKVVVRFPVGLPVLFVEQKNDRFIVQEPYGELVMFPLRPVWRLGEDIDIFEEGKKKQGELLLEEYESEEEAREEWERYSHPEKYRWYIDELRKKYKSDTYCDWEALFDIPTVTIQSILKYVSLIRDEEFDDEFWQAVADLTLMFVAGEGEPEFKRKNLEEVVAIVAETVKGLLTLDYVVKSGGYWDFEKKAFQIGKTRIAA
jgi:hypothetical protein